MTQNSYQVYSNIPFIEISYLFFVRDIDNQINKVFFSMLTYSLRVTCSSSYIDKVGRKIPPPVFIGSSGKYWQI